MENMYSWIFAQTIHPKGRNELANYPIGKYLIDADYKSKGTKKVTLFDI